MKIGCQPRVELLVEPSAWGDWFVTLEKKDMKCSITILVDFVLIEHCPQTPVPHRTPIF
jgi:hypothetical protein